MKFSIIDLFSFLRMWSHLLRKSLMENFFFCAVEYQKGDERNSPISYETSLSKLKDGTVDIIL